MRKRLFIGLLFAFFCALTGSAKLADRENFTLQRGKNIFLVVFSFSREPPKPLIMASAISSVVPAQFAILFPDDVKVIREYAFERCIAIESISFGENSQLADIQDFAFYGCKGFRGISCI